MSEIFLGLGGNGERQVLRLGRANRHGLIAGATGTGKTVTLTFSMALKFRSISNRPPRKSPYDTPPQSTLP